MKTRFSISSLIGGNAFQRVLAFAALFLLFGFFSIGSVFPKFLSPYFFSGDNFVGILLATAVNGVLALGATFVIITGGIDLSVGTVMTFSAVCTALLIGDDPHDIYCHAPAGDRGRAGRSAGRCGVRLVQRPDDCQNEDPALHCHPGHDVYHQGSQPGAFQFETDLLQRSPQFPHDDHGHGIQPAIN